MSDAVIVHVNWNMIPFGIVVLGLIGLVQPRAVFFVILVGGRNDNAIIAAAERFGEELSACG